MGLRSVKQLQVAKIYKISFLICPLIRNNSVPQWTLYIVYKNLETKS